MSKELTREAHLTQGYTNMLYAGFQGSFVSGNVFEKLGYRAPKFSSLDDVKGRLDWVHALRVDFLGGGAPLFAGIGNKEEKIFELRDSHLRELDVVVKTLAHSLNLVLERDDADACRFIAAALNRQAYGREHYIRGLTNFYEAFGMEAEADRWRQRLLSCNDEIFRANHYFQHLAAGQPTDILFRFSLWNEAVNLHGVFKSQLNDVLSLDMYFSGGDYFAALGVPAEEIEKWRLLGARPDVAGHWLSFGIGADEAALWSRIGFTDAAYAGGWRSRGFSVADALAWHEAGFAAQGAYACVVSGERDPRAAAERRSREST